MQFHIISVGEHQDHRHSYDDPTFYGPLSDEELKEWMPKLEKENPGMLVESFPLTPLSTVGRMV
jgi:hypothetical protein